MRRLMGADTAEARKLEEVKARFGWLEAGRAGAGERDPRTLEVPEAALRKMSPSQQQFWECKRAYADTVLFFKVGKFYELYEDDAEVGARELGWRMTVSGVGNCRQVGCPESGIEEACRRLVDAGYSVGRMEQVETAAEAKAARGPRACIRRRLLKVESPGTRTAPLERGLGPAAVHLLALVEAPGAGGAGGVAQATEVSFGFAFVDAAAGLCHLGRCDDGSSRSGLGALLAQVAPAEVLVPRGGLGAATSRLLRHPPFPMRVTQLDPEREFCPPGRAREALLAQPLARNARGWEAVGAPASEEALAALGGLLAHLKRLRTDSELFSQVELKKYEIYGGAVAGVGAGAALRMDGPTLANLDVLESEAGFEGSLLHCLDACRTAGGKRLLRRWVCRPLTDLHAIRRRQDAVQSLLEHPEFADIAKTRLGLLPDVERALGRLKAVCAEPPVDALPQAVLESLQRRRIATLASALVALRECWTLAREVHRVGSAGCAQRESLLRDLVAGCPGEDSVAVRTVGRLEGLLEFPAGLGTRVAFSKKCDVRLRGGEEGAELSLEGQVRLTTEYAQALVEDAANTWNPLYAGLAQLDVLLAFAEFAVLSEGPTCRPELYGPATDGMADGMARQGSGGGWMELKGVWNCVLARAGTRVVPNDVLLGGDSPASLLLTGPNMGGKSTLLRSVCVLVILAQMGCWVPAVSARLSMVDTIFTRLGARDNIMTGESTFLVEAREAAAILQNATANSLVAMDELGRGTSTCDGCAIALATFSHLKQRLCRMLFATHYGSELAADHGRLGDCRAAFGHMACLVRPEAEDGQARLAFLYKLRAGVCPRSYGIEVAGLAGIPASVLRRAEARGAALAPPAPAPGAAPDAALRAALASVLRAEPRPPELLAAWRACRRLPPPPAPP